MPSILAADAYINEYCIDVEDWADSDTNRKTRLINVAADILTRRFTSYVIPENAVYEFANVLAVKFNDTNKQAQNGVQSFTLTGVATFSFFQQNGRPESMITQRVLDLIGDANGGAKLSLRRIGRSVLG